MRIFLFLVCVLFSTNAIASGSKIISIADNYVGYHERTHNKKLRKLLGFNPARTAWCAGWANAILTKAGYQNTGSLMAKSYLKYGKKVTKPKKGDILVFNRRGGGHVGFYMGTVKKDGIKYFKVISGNSSNKVTIRLYKARSVIGIRRPVKRKKS